MFLETMIIVAGRSTQTETAACKGQIIQRCETFVSDQNCAYLLAKRYACSWLMNDDNESMGSGCGHSDDHCGGLRCFGGTFIRDALGRTGHHSDMENGRVVPDGSRSSAVVFGVE